jgi:hypothetical protein
MFDHGMSSINRYLNIDKLTRKLMEIDLIKYLLLDKHQLNVVNLISLPLIENFKKKLNNDLCYRSNFGKINEEGLSSKEDFLAFKEDKLRDIQNSFLNLNQRSLNKSKDTIDKKILESSISNFCFLFEKSS